MIVIQTPLRVSLFGGGTDFKSFYLSEGGCVLTTAINKYVFVTIKQRFDEKLRVGYTRTEIVDTVTDIQHELIREAFRTTGITEAIEITTMGDIPAGSGLGSSSAVTVGALHAMHTYLNHLVTAEQLAQEACEIEIETLHKPIGIQDQYIAAYGGIRFIEFNSTGQVNCERVAISPKLASRLDENLLLFFTGVTALPAQFWVNNRTISKTDCQSCASYEKWLSSPARNFNAETSMRLVYCWMKAGSLKNN